MNPFVRYLTDSFSLLNHALQLRDVSHPEITSMYCRASSMHAIASLHCVANSCNWSEDTFGEYHESDLVEKFYRYLELIKGDGETLTEVELAVLTELKTIETVLNNPSMAQARSVDHPEKKNLIEFERTQLKKISRESTNWIPEYAGCTLGLTVGFLNMFILDHCGMDTDKVEVILGIHASSESAYSVGLETSSLERLKVEEDKLLRDETFMETMRSERWKLPSSWFRCRLFPAQSA
ncbi:MAG: hypothetical protein KDN22_01430 [Verrucomicrobiae bacterium]|nr:hypothetical protein [Verrucomicrobiae bacterium]